MTHELDDDNLFVDKPFEMKLLVSGIQVDPLRIQAHQVRVEDIARGLSRICRYNGHVTGFISVARHAIWVAEQVYVETRDYDLAYAGLHHDDAEAYIGDMIKPMKNNPALSAFSEAEKQIERQIAIALGILHPLPAAVVKVDRTTGAWELDALRHRWDSTPQDDEETFLAFHKFLKLQKAQQSVL